MHIFARSLFACSLLACAFTGMAQTQGLYFPPKTGTAWQTTAPASLGICPEWVDSLYNVLVV